MPPRINAYQKAVIQIAQDRRQGWKERKIVKQKNAAGLTPREEQGLLKRSLKQIRERNLDTPYGFESYHKGREIADRKRKPSMWLFHTSYHARYSSREQWWISASYLCGHSDGQDWAVRVPGTKLTVEDALYWLTPAKVRNAQKAGKEVYRQGDFYFVPYKNEDFIKPHDFSALVGTRHIPGHKYNEGGWNTEIVVEHPQHPAVVLSNEHVWHAIQQKQMAAYGRRVGAD